MRSCYNDNDRLLSMFAETDAAQSLFVGSMSLMLMTAAALGATYMVRRQ